MRGFLLWLGRAFSVLAIGAVIIICGGGLDFVRRPVGAAYVGLWLLLGFSTMLFRKAGEDSAYDKSQKPALAVYGLVQLLTAYVAAPYEYSHFSGPLPRDGVLAWSGLWIFALSVLIQTWAYLSLKGLYTARLGIQAGHRLITAGAYRLVRHPGYLGFVLTMVGTVMALSSLSAVVGLVVTVAFLVRRIRYEETMLREAFGAEHEEYCNRVKKLLPGVW